MNWFTDMVFGAKVNDQGGLKKGEEYIMHTSQEVARLKAYRRVDHLKAEYGFITNAWKTGNCWEVKYIGGLLDSKYPFTPKEKAPTGDPGMTAFVPDHGWASHVESVSIAGKKYDVVGDVTDPWPMSPVELDTRAEALEKTKKHAEYLSNHWMNHLVYLVLDTYGKHFELKHPDGSVLGRYEYELKNMTSKQKAHAAAVNQVECEIAPGHVRHIKERRSYYAVILNDGSVGGTHYFTEEKVMKTVTKEEAKKEAVKRAGDLLGKLGSVVMSENEDHWGVTPTEGIREKFCWTPPKPLFKEGTCGFGKNENRPNVNITGFLVKCKKGGYLVERLGKGFEGQRIWCDEFTPLNKELNVNDAETIKNLCVVRDCGFSFGL